MNIENANSIVRRTSALLALASIAAACAADAAQGPASAVPQRDSAGVAIVEIRSPPWAAPVWATVDTVNVMRVKPLDSIPATFFRSLNSADMLRDGSIVTLDWTSGEVNVFAANGKFLRRIGRTGQGPGEFEYPVVVMVGPGDSIHVINPDQRIDVFSSDGKYARRVRLGLHSPLRALSDGSHLMSRGDDKQIVPGKNTDYATIYRLTATGDTTNELTKYLRTERTYRLNGRSHEGALQLFQPLKYAVGTSRGFVWCDAGIFLCDQWTDSGRKVRSIRVSAPPVRVTNADVNAWRTAALAKATTPRARSQVDADIAGADRAATFPAWSAFRVDGNDRIWFREYTWREGETPRRWVVVSPEGRILGLVTMPAVYKILKVGADYIICVERDQDNQQSLAVFKYAPVK